MQPRRARAVLRVALGGILAGCIPPGNSTPSDAGPPTTANPTPSSTVAARPAANVLTAPFEDNFERSSTPGANGRTPGTPGPTGPAAAAATIATPDAAGDGALAAAAKDARTEDGPVPDATPTVVANDLGPNWYQAGTNIWHIENGRLCGQGAHNHGVWMTKAIPVNARIEFDAISESPDGDLKSEVWGDGQSAATSISYTNATSYLTILGGWKNKFHVLARINEHGNDRKEITVDPNSDDPRDHPVVPGQSYHFKIERSDGKTVRWSVNGLEMFTWADAEPLSGAGHDHFGFNNWEVKVCFDNVKVTPISSL